MRTGRTLTVFWRETPPKIGDPPPQKLYTPQDQTPPPKKIGDPPKKIGDPPGTDLQGMLAYPPTPPPVNRMTNWGKNITLAKTSFRPVKIICTQDSALPLIQIVLKESVVMLLSSIVIVWMILQL